MRNLRANFYNLLKEKTRQATKIIPVIGWYVNMLYIGMRVFLLDDVEREVHRYVIQ